jgi:hypothetical protein
VYTPFLYEETGEPEVLNILEDESPVDDIADVEELSDTAEEIILEKNGIHFINSNVLSPDRETEKNLDAEFRKLVDSVIKD